MTLNIFLKFPLKHPNKASTIATKSIARNTEQRLKPTSTVEENAIEYRASGRPVLKSTKYVKSIKDEVQLMQFMHYPIVMVKIFNPLTKVKIRSPRPNLAACLRIM